MDLTSTPITVVVCLAGSVQGTSSFGFGLIAIPLPTLLVGAMALVSPLLSRIPLTP